MSDTAKKSARFAFLDGLRGVAAVYVLLHHAMLALPHTPGDHVAASLSALFRYGHYAVDVFIVLSGYCLMLPVLRAKEPLKVGNFLLRRTLRIIPTYYLAMVLALLLIAFAIGEPTGNNWDASVPVSGWDIVSHVSLFHDWFTESYAKINYAFWSIGVEWKIYFLFPLMLRWNERGSSLRTAAIAMVAGYAVWAVLWYFWWLNPSPWGSSPYYVGLFALGVCAADLGERAASAPESAESERAARSSQHWFWALSVAVVVCSWAISSLKDDRVITIVASGFVGTWSALLLYRLRIGHAPRWLDRALSTSLAAWTGQRGYSVYLLHAPLIQVVWVYVIEPARGLGSLRAPAMLSLSLLLTVVCAHVFHRFAERPFHKLSQRLGSRPA